MLPNLNLIHLAIQFSFLFLLHKRKTNNKKTSIMTLRQSIEFNGALMDNLAILNLNAA